MVTALPKERAGVVHNGADLCEIDSSVGHE